MKAYVIIEQNYEYSDSAIIWMNDHDEFSFKKLSKIIRKNPHEYFRWAKEGDKL
jgi:hypothetical protein